MKTIIQGKIIEIERPAVGESYGKNWKRQQIILDRGVDKAAITIWNDQIASNELAIDQEVKFKVQVKSREYKGKWFTDIIGVKKL